LPRARRGLPGRRHSGGDVPDPAAGRRLRAHRPHPALLRAPGDAAAGSGVSLMTLLCLVAAVDATVEIQAVRLTPPPSPLALRVLTCVPVESPQVGRVGDEVVVRRAGAIADEIALPAPEEPVRALRLEHEPDALALHVQVPPEVPFEVRQDGALLTVFFGEEQADELRMKPPSELFGLLFPVPIGDAASPPTGGPPSPEVSREGFRLGPLSVRPGLTASYVDADVVTEHSSVTPPDRFLQIGPAVSVALPIVDGTLSASYEPRLRFFSSLPEVGTPSHFANAGLDLPIGSRMAVHADYHFSHGVLETREVDPGQEYFFDLGRFTRHDVRGDVTLELHPRMGAVVGAGYNDVGFTGSTAFFPYHETSVRGGLYYEVGAGTRVTLAYTHYDVPPPPARPIAGATGY